MISRIVNFKFQIFNLKLPAGLSALLLLVATVSAPTACAQDSGAVAPTLAPRPVPTRDEGDLIELDDVQIHGEIAQPNVAITISRAEPQFRKITLEHVASEGLTDLDLSGLRGSIPPAERIRNWKEILNRPRQ